MTTIHFPDASSPAITVPPNSVTVTCTAPVNIAVIKYWGKRDERLILPINSSLSGTVHPASMKANTLIVASRTLPQSSLTLNGQTEPINKRLQAVIDALQKRAQPFQQAGQTLIAAGEWPQYKLQIVSVNNFPTAAGLASSAAGYACFTRCLAQLYGVQDSYPGELTTVARQGSGSACRSLYGGFVRWQMGTAADGKDSIASQVVDEQHWPDMRVLILVANRAQKETSSTDGMQRTVATSPLLAHRAAQLVEPRMAAMEQALHARDFSAFARLTIQDSNNFHACCLDTYPPIIYINQTSQHVIATLTAVNAIEGEGREVAAYTFDAGPNAVVYCQDKHMRQLLALFKALYGQGETDEWVYDPMGLVAAGEAEAGSVKAEWLAACGKGKKEGVKVHQVIVSRIGGGAEITSTSHTF